MVKLNLVKVHSSFIANGNNNTLTYHGLAEVNAVDFQNLLSVIEYVRPDIRYLVN